MPAEPSLLIVGSDSMVGGALMTHLRQANERVIGTTRRRDAVDGARVYLDLAGDVERWRCPGAVSVTVICASITKRDACRRDPENSARVNVDGVSRLVTRLVDQGAFVIYLSTSQVFDGKTPHRLPDEPYSPVTEYGRQRVKVERDLSRWGDAVAIVRFTKILRPSDPLFTAWSDALRRGEPIHPFSDMVLSPVPLSCAVSVLRLVVDARLPGILQVSGDRDISYAEAARWGAEVAGADPHLVQSVSVNEVGAVTEPAASHTTLNSDRLRSVWGIEPPDVRWTVESIFARSHQVVEPVSGKVR